MAGNTINKNNINSNTLNLPDEVVDSSWEDDVDVDYAIYGGTEAGERVYRNRNEVPEQTLEEAKALRVKLQGVGIKTLFSLQREALATAA